MTPEENIRALSMRVVAAPENSQEFRVALEELHTALNASAARGREKIAEMQKAHPPPEKDSA